MQIACFFLLGTFLLTLQTTLFTSIPSWMGTPELLFILIVFVAIRMKTYEGAILVLLYGMIMDVFSGLYLGLYPGAYLLLFFLIRVVSKHLLITETTHQPPLVATSYLFIYATISFFSVILDNNQSGLIWSWWKLLLQTFILALLAIPFFHLYDLLFNTVKNFTRKKHSLLRPKSGNRFIT
ncbi:MAG: rod shape-determining protein MreD [Proteobacteria bacterium]|nr:rod shape-determining protein MreD [Pseudomonadota bacterium]MBU1716176.1 rod shape-determining protein MreD [Pseudomonadota bacterium]